MKIETNIPHKGLRRWCEANPDKVAAIGHLPGFCDDNGNDCRCYDILLTDDYHRTDGGGHRCIIERSGKEALDILRNWVERCPGGDCC